MGLVEYSILAGFTFACLVCQLFGTNRAIRLHLIKCTNDLF